MAKTPELKLTANYQRNYLINGNFDIWQRGTSTTISTPVSQYLADRWTSFPGNGTMTVTRQVFASGQTDVPGFPTAFQRCQMTVAATTSAYTQQRIEDVTKLAGKKATLTFWAKAAAGINVQIRTIQSFGTGGSSTVDTLQDTIAITTVWTKYTVTLDIPDVAGKTIVAGNNNYLNISFGLPINTTFTFDLAQVQLVEGAQELDFRLATSDINLERLLCYRYYWQPTSGTFLGSGYFELATQVFVSFRFPVEMRVTPVPSILSATGIIYTRVGSSNGNFISGNFSSTTVYGTFLFSTSISGNSVVAYPTLVNTSGASVLAFDAEL
jgi:hypothetical protein